MVLRASTGISSGGGGSGTVTQVNTGTGLTGGPITTTGTVSLANTAVTAATYGSNTTVAQITIDAQGRITAAANVAISGGGGGSGTVNSGTLGQIAYYDAAGTAVSGLTTGTGVTTALGVNTGSAGAFVVNGGALGTPSSGTLTNATGLPLTTGVTGLLPVANGGLAANVSPTTAGNVIFSTNGTTWSSTAKIVQGTLQNTTSGVAIGFTGIPSWTKRITLLLNEVSSSGTSGILVQIGSGSYLATGYNGGFGVTIPSNGTTVTGTTGGTTAYNITGGITAAMTISATISLNNITGNVWSFYSAATRNNATAASNGIQNFQYAPLTLSGALDRIQILTGNGTDTFDAGSFNILYE